MNEMNRYLVINLLLVLFTSPACSQGQGNQLKVGAERTDRWYPLIENKMVAVVANQTSLIGHVHLVDTLLAGGFNVVKVFGPEHGFRGQAGAGEEVGSNTDPVTGLPIVSLYGKNKKPKNDDLDGIEIMIYDIQDVGVRFYTYISTMTYVMEACAENSIPVLILDSPNPNGFYIDGPILEPECKSFVGLHPVPIVYGMTSGEYAMMVNGEQWLENGLTCDLTVVPVENYTHRDMYDLPVRPSPNLPNQNAVLLYPSLCLFEGTIVSVGRGTDFPFQVIGHPDFVIGSYIFTPRSIPGAAPKPLYEGKQCCGTNLTGFIREIGKAPDKLILNWLLGYYEFFKDKTVFFNSYFRNLAGTTQLQKQIEEGLTEEQIRESWQPGLKQFKEIRKKYLLYPDF